MMKHKSWIIFVSCFLLFLCRNELPAQSRRQIVNEFRRGNLSFVARNCDEILVVEVGAAADTVAGTENQDARRIVLERIWNIVPKSEIERGTLKSSGNGDWLLVMKSFNSNGELESESALVFDFVSRQKRYKLHRIYIAG